MPSFATSKVEKETATSFVAVSHHGFISGSIQEFETPKSPSAEDIGDPSEDAAFFNSFLEKESTQTKR